MGREKWKQASAAARFLEVPRGISEETAEKGSHALEFITQINIEGDGSLQPLAFEEDRKDVKWLIQLLSVFLDETELTREINSALSDWSEKFKMT